MQPKALRPALELFCRHYDANGNNGVQAWLASHPNTRTIGSAAVSSYRALRNAQIAARVAELAQERYKLVAMTAEEATALVAGDARADARQLFDEAGKMLAPHLWPDSIARSVKGVRIGADGQLAVTLNDSLAARKLMLEQTGALKSPLTPLTDLADLIAGKFKEGE